MASWTKRGTVRGPQGIQGTQGIQGIQGPQGLQGSQGSQGVPGLVVRRGAGTTASPLTSVVNPLRWNTLVSTSSTGAATVTLPPGLALQVLMVTATVVNNSTSILRVAQVTSVSTATIGLQVMQSSTSTFGGASMQTSSVSSLVYLDVLMSTA